MNILTIDVGNSTVSIGLFQNNHLTHRWSFNTFKEVGAGVYFDKQVSHHFWESRVSFDMVDEIVFSSVVPELSKELIHACEKLFGVPVLMIQPEIYDKLSMDFINPMEIGTDIVANLVQAHKNYKKICLVVDFGTALTFSVVNKEGRAEGVAIVPGIKTAFQSLFANTSQLPEVSFESSKEILGTDTVSAIQAGVINGYTGLLHHMITRIRSQYFNQVFVIGTGGLAGLILEVNPHFNIIDKDFTLKGLYTIWKIVREN